MILTLETRQKIRNLAANNPKEEICGLIVNSDAFSCKNVSIDPAQNFVLSPLDYLKASKAGKIQAIFHSHIGPKEEASLIDKDSAAKHNLPIITYNLPNDCFDEFSQNMGISHVGKDFKLGKSDCFTLFLDYYKEELGIELPKVTDLSHYSNNSVFFGKAEFFGFKEVQTRRQHDVLLSRKNGRNHLLMYLGHNKVLHQPINAKSLIQDIDPEIEKYIIGTFRHASFISGNPEKLPS